MLPRNPSFVLLLLAGTAPAALGQVELDRAEFNVTEKVITVSSTSDGPTFDAAVSALSEEANWSIYYRGARYRVEAAHVDRTQRVIRLEYDTESLTMPSIQDLEVGDLVLKFGPPGVNPVVVQNQERSAFVRGLNFTDSKKDADVDLSGGMQAAAHAKPQYFWTAKASYPFTLRPGFGHIDPSFEGEASQQEDADPDSLKASLVYSNRWPVVKRGGVSIHADLIGYEFERSIKNEHVLVTGEVVQREFLKKNSNLVWSARARWTYGWKPLNFDVGFVGFETGKALTRTIKADSPEEKKATVSRLRFDLDAHRDFFTSSGKRILTLDAHYTLRLPLKEEPFQRTGENDGEPFLTEKARYWLNVNLGLLLRDGLGVSLQFKHGSLPPSFEFVDRQVTLGFNLLLKRK